MSNDTREALAAKCKDLADTLYTGPVAHKAACVRLVHAAIDELAALTEQPAAPQPSNLGDSVERCGSPSGAVSGGSGIGAFDKVAFQLALNVRHKDCHRAADAFWEYWNANGETHKRGYYESTWGAINRAIRLVGVVPHDYGCGQPSQRDPCPQCRPGVVCRTPKCGRLRVSSLAVLAKHGQPQGGKEAAQRERMAEKFANRATTQATADFDLPARSDVVQPQGGSNG